MDDFWLSMLAGQLARQRFEMKMERFLAGLKELADAEERRETKALPLDVTALDAGEFVGLAAVYDVVDLQSDSIERGAFADSLRQRRTFPLLWSHNLDEPLGVVEVEDAPEGLRVRGRLNLAVQRAKEIYALLRQGATTGLSIGYNTIRSLMRGSVRVLREIQLHEISLVTVPAQPLAQVRAVKSQSLPRDRWEDGIVHGWAEPERSH